MHMCTATLLILAAAIAASVIYTTHFMPPLEKPKIEDGWFGRGEEINGKPSTEIVPFKIKVEDSVLTDLQARLANFRPVEGLEDAQFNYGFRPGYTKSIITHWREKYNWKAQEKKLNQYQHYKTKIEGIDVHFLHVKPALKAGQTSKPLLMVHGWPGSFYEFYKVIPMLTEPTKYNGTEDDIFEVICPSIPGYGFSEAPHKKGFNPVAAARVFHKLMTRLRFVSYYVQGGDWGSIITTTMSVMYESSVKGLHVNMIVAPPGPKYFGKMLLGTVAPGVVLDQSEWWKLYPLGEKLLGILRESGYMHIQATKPDTIGQGLNDSPVGLAVYILEKFSTWTDMKNVIHDDGALTAKFKMDDVLTNVMIYWVTGSITSSMRFYKENFGCKEVDLYQSLPVRVPTGLASYRNELFLTPKSFAAERYTNIVQYSDIDGGHFAAFEVPETFVEDFRSFIRKVETNDK